MSPVTAISTTDFDPAPLLDDLGLPADALSREDELQSLTTDSVGGASEVRSRIKLGLGEAGAVLIQLDGRPNDVELAKWRNDLWPILHMVAIYELGETNTRRSLQGRQSIAGSHPGSPCTVLAMRRVSHVMSPDATREKFDQNASGWNGEPGGPGYPHFRWMRKLVGKFAPAVDGQRIIDFGCGAGWVGIEAAKDRSGISLAAFDPSPEMVKIAEANAAKEGIADFTGRVGFGEAPPFPAEGEEAFDLVISSGVVSFSPDFEAWMRGLVRCCKPGATLVVGDINPDSRGFKGRRDTKPLLPIRELNGCRAGDVRAWLEAKGFTHRKTVGYQATWPMPQAMQVNERFLKGLISHPLVWINAGLTALDSATGHALSGQFDSWVMHFDVPATWDASTLD